jgi:hypothetical protein
MEMKKKIALTSLAVLFAGAMAFAGGNGKAAKSSSKSSMSGKTYYAVITDSNCGLKHSVASAEAAACVEKCVKGGAKYEAVYHKKLYQLEPQDKFEGMGGKRVKITGSEANGTITADTVTALPDHPMKTMKKSS